MRKLSKLALAALSVLAVSNLASCGPKADITLVLAGPADWEEMNLDLIEAFKADRAASGDTKTYDIQYVHYGENDVDSKVLNWKEGPDVYAFASDKIGELYKKGALAKLAGLNEKFVEDNMTSFAVEVSSFADGVYAYPMTADNTYYTQYDASQLSAAQVENIEDMLDAAHELGKKVAYNLPEAFWGGAAMFTFGADYEINYDADGNVTSTTADFDSPAGVKAAKAIYKILSHPAWTKDTADPDAIACLDGTWAISGESGYKAKWGANYACAVMPKVTVDGETKNLGAFVGCKLLGVNPQRSTTDQQRLVAAHQLAQFLTGAQSQLTRYQVKGNVPCHNTALEDPDLASDPNVLTLNAQHAFAHAQTPVPGAFWTAPGQLVQSMLSTDPAFEATETAFQQLCDTMNASIESAK